MLDVNNNLDEIKDFAKIDGDDEDVNKDVKRAFMTAISYTQGAVGLRKKSFYTSLDENDTEKINMVLLMLTDHFYKNRSATVDSNSRGTVKEPDLGITSMVLQLKAAYARYEGE